MEHCSKHAEKDAVGRCFSCGKYLCRECIAQQKDGKLLCYDCAVKATSEEMDHQEKQKEVIATRKKEEAKKGVREGVKGVTVFIIVGIIIIVLQGGVILADYFLRKPADVSFISSNLIEMRYKRDLCAENLSRISGAIETHKKDHGSLPPNLGTVFPKGDDPVLTCPATGKPYGYAVNEKSFTLSCPSPEAHSLVFLIDRDGALMWQKVGE